MGYFCFWQIEIWPLSVVALCKQLILNDSKKTHDLIETFIPLLQALLVDKFYRHFGSAFPVLRKIIRYSSSHFHLCEINSVEIRII